MRSPILIIGAGRSGTKLIRSILDSSPRIVSFPREINYIWRFGNPQFPTDELQPSHARQEVIVFIRKKFQHFAADNKNSIVLEKTCANSLRLDYVMKIFPEAFIIHIIRDGRAVAESARKRWTASPDLKYLAQKFRWVPIRDMPYYFYRFIKYQLTRIDKDHQSVSSWGPRFSGLDKLVQEKSLIEVCGYQWKACIQSTREGFTKISDTQKMTINYEDLVRNPHQVAERIFDRIGIDFSDASKNYLTDNVDPAHINKWQSQLTEEDLASLMPIIEEELLYLGYEV